LGIYVVRGLAHDGGVADGVLEFEALVAERCAADCVEQDLQRERVSISEMPRIRQSSKTIFDSGFRVSGVGFRTPMPMSASWTRSTENIEVLTTSPNMPMFHARQTLVRFRFHYFLVWAVETVDSDQ